MALVNKVALVTGSSGGIGFAISKEFAENQGATVLVCSRNINDAIRTSQKIKGNTQAVELDVTNERDVRSVVKGAILDHGGIDILVNSAGHRFESAIWYKKIPSDDRSSIACYYGSRSDGHNTHDKGVPS